MPELSVCVWPGHHGAGAGRLLIEAALAAARDRGLGRVSLCVEAGNPARGLYQSVGFLDVEGSADGAMVVDLR